MTIPAVFSHKGVYRNDSSDSAKKEEGSHESK